MLGETWGAPCGQGYAGHHGNAIGMEPAVCADDDAAGCYRPCMQSSCGAQGTPRAVSTACRVATATAQGTPRAVSTACRVATATAQGTPRAVSTACRDATAIVQGTPRAASTARMEGGLHIETAVGPACDGGLFSLDALWAELDSEVDEKQRIVDRALQEWGLWDEKMSPLARQERYIRFKGVQFPMAPKEVWPQLRRDLLTCGEAHFACRQHDVGLVHGYKFDIDIPSHVRLMQKTPWESPDRKKWVADELYALQRSGVIKRVSEVQCAAALVLVAGQQTGQSYRVCYNAIDINAVSPQGEYPFPDSRAMIDSCVGARVLSALDLKAGYHNIENTERTKGILGITTEEGLFRWERMPFGPHAAPRFFQYVMDSILQPLGLRSFLDDLKTQGHTWQECWAQTLAAIRLLTRAGFMINLHKCKMLVPACMLLGCWVSASEVALGEKYMRNLSGIGIPATWSDLQALLGRLQWAAPFLPAYKKLVAPIEGLLAQRGRVVWSSECTQALQRLVDMVFAGLRLRLPVPGAPYRLYPDFDDDHILIVLTQGTGEEERPVVFLGRRCQLSEKRLTPIERLVRAVWWALHKLARYTSFSATSVVVPDSTLLATFKVADIHRTLQGYLADLSMYQLSWCEGPSFFQYCMDWINLSFVLDPLYVPKDKVTGQPLECPVIAHREVVLRRPEHPEAGVMDGRNTCAYFDGSSQGELGAGGFVVWDSRGQLVKAQALWFGSQQRTNNTAEMAALVALLQYMVMAAGVRIGQLQVAGDSKLIIDFCRRLARPGRPELFLAYRQVQQLRKQLPRVRFCHVPREVNDMADWLCAVSRWREGDVDMTKWCVGLPVGARRPCSPLRAAQLVAECELGQGLYALHSLSCWDSVVGYLRDMGLCPLESAVAIESWRSSMVAGMQLSYMNCPICSHPHVDAGSFATKAHRVHICSRCGARFEVENGGLGVGNPLVALGAELRDGRVHVPMSCLGHERVTFIGTTTEPQQGSRRRKLPGRRQHTVCCVCEERLGVTRQCWGPCGRWFHAACGTAYEEFPQGPWVCLDCQSEDFHARTREFTSDEALMRFIATGIPPLGAEEAELARLLDASAHLRWDGSRLWFRGHGSNAVERQVPPRWRRPILIRNAQSSLGYPGGRRLYALLKGLWYWPGMLTQCVRICAEATPCQLEHARFPPPAYLLPTRKDLYPFHTVAVDLVTGVRFSAGEPKLIMIVVVCAFCKWVEADVLKTRDARTVARWFHHHIVCRYGTPVCVRSDHGREFQGAFNRYLTRMGIKHTVISVCHPRANGLVERYNGILRAGLRKMFAAMPGVPWQEYLPEVLVGLRLLPTKMGLSPFVLLYKQEPRWPIGADPAAHVTEPDIDLPEDVPDDEWWGKVMRVWEQMLKHAQERLIAADKDMVAAYSARIPAQLPDVRALFAPGDRVLLKQKQPGKNKIRASGPYEFKTYSGRRGVTAIIAKPDGEDMRVSVANLIPFRGEGHAVVHELPAGCGPVEGVDPILDSSDSSDTEDDD